MGVLEICLPDIAPDVLLVSSPVPLECDGDVIYVLGALKEVPDENFMALLLRKDASIAGGMMKYAKEFLID